LKAMMDSAGDATSPVSNGALPNILDIEGRLKRNPYGMVAGAVGIGFVLGGGLFTRLSAKIFDAGLRAALMAVLPVLGEHIAQIVRGPKLNKEKGNDQ
jgi:hypothetical protein